MVDIEKHFRMELDMPNTNPQSKFDRSFEETLNLKSEKQMLHNPFREDFILNIVYKID